LNDEIVVNGGERVGAYWLRGDRRIQLRGCPNPAINRYVDLVVAIIPWFSNQETMGFGSPICLRKGGPGDRSETRVPPSRFAEPAGIGVMTARKVSAGLCWKGVRGDAPPMTQDEPSKSMPFQAFAPVEASNRLRFQPSKSHSLRHPMV
jgi:hypothetical protein